MESWIMRQLRLKRQAKKEKVDNLICDVVGSVLVVVFVIVCCLWARECIRLVLHS